MTASARRDMSKISVPASQTEKISATSPRPEEIASYIAQLSGEMASLARGARLDLLAYFLEMARLEAAGHAER